MVSKLALIFKSRASGTKFKECRKAYRSKAIGINHDAPPMVNRPSGDAALAAGDPKAAAEAKA